MRKNNINFKLLLRLFPFIDNINNLKKIKIDDESIYYITDKEHANKITSIIINHINRQNLNYEDLSIIDTTAGVGGNTISFGQKFKNILAIEIDHKRCQYLKNNINIYKLKNITILHGDFIDFINNNTNIIHDIIFIDPPWGGRDYKKEHQLTLTLSNIPIEKLCNQLLNINKIIMIVLKLPLNYDLKYLYNNIKSKKIYIHTLNKMLLVIIQK